MASVHLDKRWLAVGAAAALLAVGLMLPRPGGSAHVVAIADATVPPPLVRPSGDAAALGTSPTPESSGMAVYVCGAVKNPGVYTFAQGKRVVDALQRAGGPTPDADIEQINLAQPLNDAMKVTVPHKGQVLPAAATGSSDSPGLGGRRHRHSHGGSRGAHKLSAGQTLDVNTASVEELVQLPGVGPGLAQRIVDYRQQNGPFQTVDDLQNVPGIGPSKFDRLAPYVRL
jgi:competence protein ComEA